MCFFYLPKKGKEKQRRNIKIKLFDIFGNDYLLLQLTDEVIVQESTDKYKQMDAWTPIMYDLRQQISGFTAKSWVVSHTHTVTLIQIPPHTHQKNHKNMSLRGVNLYGCYKKETFLVKLKIYQSNNCTFYPPIQYFLGKSVCKLLYFKQITNSHRLHFAWVKMNWRTCSFKSLCWTEIWILKASQPEFGLSTSCSSALAIVDNSFLYHQSAAEKDTSETRKWGLKPFRSLMCL